MGLGAGRWLTCGRTRSRAAIALACRAASRYTGIAHGGERGYAGCLGGCVTKLLARLLGSWQARAVALPDASLPEADRAETTPRTWGNMVYWASRDEEGALVALAQGLLDRADRLNDKGKLEVGLYFERDLTPRIRVPNADRLAALAATIAALTADKVRMAGEIELYLRTIADLRAQLAGATRPLWRGHTTTALLVRDRAGNPATDPTFGKAYPAGAAIEVWGETTVPLRPGTEPGRRYFYRPDKNLNVFTGGVVRD